MRSLIGDSGPNSERWFSFSETFGPADASLLGVDAGQPESTTWQFAAFAKYFMLRACQQIALPGPYNNEPVLQSDPIIGDKFQTPCVNFVCAGLGKCRERLHDISFCVEHALIGKPLPFETTVAKFDRVAFISNACRLVNTLVVCASDEQQRQADQNCAKCCHASGVPANSCPSG